MFPTFTIFSSTCRCHVKNPGSSPNGHEISFYYCRYYWLHPSFTLMYSVCWIYFNLPGLTMKEWTAGQRITSWEIWRLLSLIKLLPLRSFLWAITSTVWRRLIILSTSTQWMAVSQGNRSVQHLEITWEMACQVTVTLNVELYLLPFIHMHMGDRNHFFILCCLFGKILCC